MAYLNIYVVKTKYCFQLQSYSKMSWYQNNIPYIALWRQKHRFLFVTQPVSLWMYMRVCRSCSLLIAGAIPPTDPGPGMFPATAAACAAAAAWAVAACCCICLWHWRRSNTWKDREHFQCFVQETWLEKDEEGNEWLPQKGGKMFL